MKHQQRCPNCNCETVTNLGHGGGLNMDIFKRCARLGPGGLKCSCCGPAPGKRRKALRRRARRRLKQADAKAAAREERP